ncbi:hypothetical protein [Streptosporangium sp. NPDC000396]|uniref:hypothetical protein n=1 Tax=Streptosporangium sp. NPDC000396 TaxID=3366185 RepID=UPI003681AE70
MFENARCGHPRFVMIAEAFLDKILVRVGSEPVRLNKVATELEQRLPKGCPVE